ncbi:ferredoxin [Pseudonocardia ailaonensis]|uniref:ferredoxin n=1 Tax=Pseudonocardia ailaonensis TaxID=367279 RepID=UPI0031D09230
MSLSVTVDYDRCEGHGLCVAAVPEAFQLDDNGDLEVQEGLSTADPEKLEVAVSMCPVAALSARRG